MFSQGLRGVPPSFSSLYHQYFPSNYADKKLFWMLLQGEFLLTCVWLPSHKGALSVRFPTHCSIQTTYCGNELYAHLKEGQERPCHIMEGILNCEFTGDSPPVTKWQNTMETFLYLSGFSSLVNKTSKYLD